MNDLTTKNFNKALVNLKLLKKHKEIRVNDINEINICYKANLVKIDEKNNVSLLEAGKDILRCSSKTESYIKIVENLIYYNQPDWIHEIHNGIENAKINLPGNFITIFHSLGLFNSENREVIIWWNKQKTFKRNYQDQQRSLQGLYAEFLVYDFEKIRTKNEPSHMSINDDSLGYDILSVKSEKDHKDIMIEVKSSSSNNLRFFLTSNEYNKCHKFKNDYFIYLIDESDKNKKHLYVIKWKDIKLHIPKNIGKGEWKNVEIKPDSSFLKKCEKHIFKNMKS
jgi:hypothetical protein